MADAPGRAAGWTLLCRAAAPVPDADALADAVAAVRDWGGVLALAERNRLTALLHRRLSGVGGVPADAARHLREAFAANARHALTLSGELRRLLAALAAAGVSAAAYKGPPLAVRAYGDVALRQYSDLDVLAPPPQVPAAAAVLEAHGYLPYHRLTPRQERLFRRADGDYPYHHPRTGAMVELHAHVSSIRAAARLPTEALLARVQHVSVGGGTVPALADDDLLMALAVHGAKHRWARLEWVASFAALAVHARADVDTLVARGAGAGAGRRVLLAFGLAHDLLGAAIPPAVRAAFRADGGLARLAAEAVSLMRAADVPEGDATAANLRYNYRACDGPADRARFAARWLLTPSPEDWKSVPLPDVLSPAYRLIRPLRLALRYGPRGGPA